MCALWAAALADCLSFVLCRRPEKAASKTSKRKAKAKPAHKPQHHKLKPARESKPFEERVAAKPAHKTKPTEKKPTPKVVPRGSKPTGKAKPATPAKKGAKPSAPAHKGGKPSPKKPSKPTRPSPKKHTKPTKPTPKPAKPTRHPPLGAQNGAVLLLPPRHPLLCLAAASCMQACKPEVTAPRLTTFYIRDAVRSNPDDLLAGCGLLSQTSATCHGRHIALLPTLRD